MNRNIIITALCLVKNVYYSWQNWYSILMKKRAIQCPLNYEYPWSYNIVLNTLTSQSLSVDCVHLLRENLHEIIHTSSICTHAFVGVWLHNVCLSHPLLFQRDYMTLRSTAPIDTVFQASRTERQYTTGRWGRLVVNSTACLTLSPWLFVVALPLCAELIPVPVLSRINVLCLPQADQEAGTED